MREELALAARMIKTRYPITFDNLKTTVNKSHLLDAWE